MSTMPTMPSASSLFSAYASFSATVMLVRSVVYQVVPQPIRNYLVSAVLYFIKRPSPGKLTLAIEEDTGMARNEVFDAAEVYLSTKVGPNTKRLRISKTPNETGLNIKLHDGEKVSDNYDGVSLAWSFVSSTESSDNPKDPRRPHKNVKRQFELSFAKEHRDKVLNSYLPFVMEQSKVAKGEDKGVKLFTLGSYGYGAKAHWDSVNMEHPATFDKLAMDPNVKRAVVEDLDRFVKRKEFYKKVGRAWKRGYLLHGPPGTGKSSLVAAMANHLKFDIYDLQLANIMRDSDLRRLLLATSNRSILVIEDIDCSAQLPDRHQGPEGRKPLDLQLTLSGLLNFIDGLWSSCGDERIIIFTTNHMEKLDPALLRPGRMDLHIHMSYCTSDGFSLLANNYLGISAAGTAHSHVFGEIGHLMTLVQVTPAQVAEELMKNEEPATALGEVVNLLKRKGVEGNEQSEDRDVADQNGGKKHRSADVITENGICTE